MTLLFNKQKTKPICPPAEQTIITNLNQIQTAENRFYRQTLKRLGVTEEEGFTQRMNNDKCLAQQLRHPQ